MKIISPSAWITQPWRNGGGTTHEVLREGPADAFLFRVSVAEVGSSGPFSRFAGVDRVITLLEGPGLVLSFADGRRVSLPTRFSPFAFSGDDAVECALLDGPVRDLNLMVDRARVSLEVERVSVTTSTRLPPRGAGLYAFVLEGTLTTPAGLAGPHDLVVADGELDVAGHAELLVARVHTRVSPR